VLAAALTGMIVGERGGGGAAGDRQGDQESSNAHVSSSRKASGEMIDLG
jgi:hypothetical protein